MRKKARENMVESSKILTVSYGTFSCTLEGFDDSFGTMKAIAEYFRDLAERDRYFGAEPPTPDAEMLTRIAEREIDRRVDATMDDNGIVLRAAQALAPAAPVAAAAATAAVETAPTMPPQQTPPATVAPDAAAQAPVAAQENEVEDQTPSDVTDASGDLSGDPAYIVADGLPDQSETVMLDTSADAADEGLTFSDMAPSSLANVPSGTDSNSVAAKLRRIRAVVGKGTSEDETSERTDDNAPFVANDDLVAEDDADSAVAEDIVDIDETIETPVEAAIETDSLEEDAVASEAEPEQSIDAPLEDEASAIADEPTSTDAEQEVDASQASDADEQPSELVSDEASSDAATSDDDDSETAKSEDATVPAAAAAVEPEQPAKKSIRARILRVARPLRPTPVEAAGKETPKAEDIADPAPEAADAEPVAEAGDVQSLISRVRSNVKETETAETGTDQVNGAAFEPSVDAQEQDVVAELSEDSSEDLSAETPENVEATDSVGSIMSALQGFQNVDAATEEDTSSVATNDVVEADDDASDVAIDEDVAEVAETTLSAADEAELQEELAEVEREIEEVKSSDRPGRDILPETDDAAMSRILNRTDEQLAEPENSRRRNAISQLKAAVAATEAARQLGDKTDTSKPEEEFRSDFDNVVRPRRASNLPKAEIRTERPRPAPLKLVAAQRIDEANEEAPAAPVQARRVSTAAASADAGNFAEFAEEMGATELEDLLEAAAAYTAFVEGNDDFSRPQIMQKVQATSESGYSREDSLRSFGTLLREGRINKVRNGRFQISSQSRFNPEQKAG